jgi:hypothetical protein
MALLAGCWRAVDLVIARWNLQIARLNLLSAWLNLNAARCNRVGRDVINELPALPALSHELGRIDEQLYAGVPLSEWMALPEGTAGTSRKSRLRMLQEITVIGTSWRSRLSLLQEMTIGS